MRLPPDSHVHSEWSWDTVVGSMAGSCQGPARYFREAAAMAEAHGFGPGRRPYDLWGRAG